MKKQKLYFVQTGCVFNDEHFLPYATGIIAAYALQNEKIKNSYEFADIIYKCDDFKETLSNIRDASVVAFSNYMWNFEFNLRLAKEIKEKNKTALLSSEGIKFQIQLNGLKNIRLLILPFSEKVSEVFQKYYLHCARIIIFQISLIYHTVRMVQLQPVSDKVSARI